MASNLASGGADVNTIMKCGGWTTYEAMVGYTRVNDSLARHSYDSAMQVVRKPKAAEPRRKSLSVADLLERRATKAVKSVFSEV